MDSSKKDCSKKVDNVSVNSKWCIECGICVSIGNWIFKFWEDRKSIVNRQPADKKELDLAKQAEWACPVWVITVKEWQIDKTKKE